MLMEEYGTRKSEPTETVTCASSSSGKEGDATSEPNDGVRHNDKPCDEGEQKPKGHLIEKEERVVGAVKWETYRQYGRAVGSPTMIIFVMLMLVLAQCATIGNNMFLGAWSGQTIKGFTPKQYMAVYGGEWDI